MGKGHFASVPPQEESMNFSEYLSDFNWRCLPQDLLADCFVIYAALKETKGHLPSNQDRDERTPVAKFPVESGENIKGEKISLFHEKLGNVSQFPMSLGFPCEGFKFLENSTKDKNK